MLSTQSYNGFCIQIDQRTKKKKKSSTVHQNNPFHAVSCTCCLNSDQLAKLNQVVCMYNNNGVSFYMAVSQTKPGSPCITNTHTQTKKTVKIPVVL